MIRAFSSIGTRYEGYKCSTIFRNYPTVPAYTDEKECEEGTLFEREKGRPTADGPRTMKGAQGWGGVGVRRATQDRSTYVATLVRGSLTGWGISKNQ